LYSGSILAIPRKANYLKSRWVNKLEGIRSSIGVEPVCRKFIQRDFNKAILNHNTQLKRGIIVLCHPDPDYWLKVVIRHFDPKLRAATYDRLADDHIILATICH
jgi:hypothetical protein